jgi:hypothetical protein
MVEPGIGLALQGGGLRGYVRQLASEVLNSVPVVAWRTYKTAVCYVSRSEVMVRSSPSVSCNLR